MADGSQAVAGYGEPTRRGMLGLAAAGVAGIAGLLAGRAGLGANTEGSGTGASDASSLTFSGRGFRLQSAGDGASRTVHGELYDGAGARLGEFSSTALAPHGSSGSELHTLTLDGGAILAMGAIAEDLEAPNVFAVVGGTGRYAGASGTYTLRQSPAEIGGDGSAEIVINLDR